MALGNAEFRGFILSGNGIRVCVLGDCGMEMA